MPGIDLVYYGNHRQLARLRRLGNGDTLAGAYSGAPQIYCSATTSAKAGKYTINGTIGTLRSQNYYFVGVPGTLTILP